MSPTCLPPFDFPSVEDLQAREVGRWRPRCWTCRHCLRGRTKLDFRRLRLATGRFRLTEYRIVPGGWYNVTGTCVENPRSHKQTDRDLIVKGQNESTLLISWRDEDDIESRFRNRAPPYIFGGGQLAVGCLYFCIWFAQVRWI